MVASVVADYTAHLDAKHRLNGPDRQDITIIGLEPHPKDKKNGAYVTRMPGYSASSMISEIRLI